MENVRLEQEMKKLIDEMESIAIHKEELERKVVEFDERAHDSYSNLVTLEESRKKSVGIETSKE